MRCTVQFLNFSKSSNSPPPNFDFILMNTAEKSKEVQSRREANYIPSSPPNKKSQMKLHIWRTTAQLLAYVLYFTIIQHDKNWYVVYEEKEGSSHTPCHLANSWLKLGERIDKFVVPYSQPSLQGHYSFVLHQRQEITPPNTTGSGLPDHSHLHSAQAWDEHHSSWTIIQTIKWSCSLSDQNGTCTGQVIHVYSIKASDSIRLSDTGQVYSSTANKKISLWWWILYLTADVERERERDWQRCEK